MLAAVSRAFFRGLADSRTIESVASRYARSHPSGAVRRFIAGETPGEAIAAAQLLASAGLLASYDYLGEGITSLDDADAAARAYLDAMRTIAASGADRCVSLKLSQLGLAIDRAVCTDNVRRILALADREQFFVRLDTERSADVETTFDLFRTLWSHGSREFGVTVQAALLRSEADLSSLVEMGAPVRLVKGAYREPAALAHQKPAQVSAAFARLSERLLASGSRPALATHDPALVAHAKAYAAAHGIGRERFEFQMLYGLRRDLQGSLAAEGYRVRVYIPFGARWFPYVMRRIGERPSNLAHLAAALRPHP